MGIIQLQVHCWGTVVGLGLQPTNVYLDAPDLVSRLMMGA